MDAFDIIRSLSALGFVVALIYGLGVIVQRIRPLQLSMNQDKPESRLRTIETHTIDARRKLLLVRFDDQEHLIMLGADGETLISTQAAKEIEASEQNLEQTNKEISTLSTKEMTGQLPPLSALPGLMLGHWRATSKKNTNNTEAA